MFEGQLRPLMEVINIVDDRLQSSSSSSSSSPTSLSPGSDPQISPSSPSPPSPSVDLTHVLRGHVIGYDSVAKSIGISTQYPSNTHPSNTSYRNTPYQCTQSTHHLYNTNTSTVHVISISHPTIAHHNITHPSQHLFAFTSPFTAPSLHLSLCQWSNPTLSIAIAFSYPGKRMRTRTLRRMDRGSILTPGDQVTHLWPYSIYYPTNDMANQRVYLLNPP